MKENLTQRRKGAEKTSPAPSPQPPAPSLILVRHGQTDWNHQRRFQGTLDIPMNAAGIAQLQATAQQLRNDAVTRIIASPQQRARQSAVIIAAQLTLPVRLEYRLQEMNLGTWQGENYDIRDPFPDWFETAPHGGETGAQFRTRIQEWVQKTTFDGTTLVVVHGLVIKTILNMLLDESSKHLHSKTVKNGSITRLEKISNFQSQISNQRKGAKEQRVEGPPQSPTPNPQHPFWQLTDFNNIDHL